MKQVREFVYDISVFQLVNTHDHIRIYNMKDFRIHHYRGFPRNCNCDRLHNCHITWWYGQHTSFAYIMYPLFLIFTPYV